MKTFLPVMTALTLLSLQRHYSNHCDAMIAASRYAYSGQESDNKRYRQLFWRSFSWLVAFIAEITVTLIVMYRDIK